MRCKCCDSPNTKYTLGDFYCSECASSIAETIYEDSWADEYKKEKKEWTNQEETSTFGTQVEIPSTTK